MPSGHEQDDSQASYHGEVIEALADRYRVQRELGHGGMATVYLAEDERHHRLVAIKVLRPEIGNSLGSERFLREIAVTASLHHPHILTLHDSGEARGLLYYVMPYVDGETLRQRLARVRQLPVEEAVQIAADIAGALDYAHRHGVIHRDVKPENVLLHEGRAMVADFGIARAIQRAGANTLTATGVSIGTPQYMSPEQAAGETEVDSRTDTFSLGVVLYEMLAGSTPFLAPTAQGTIAKILAEAPRPVANERRTVPPNVGAAVMRALEKLPADRFPTAAQFASALLASPEASPNAFPRTTRRRFNVSTRDALWAAMAVALAAGTFLATRKSADYDGDVAAQPVRFTLTIADSQKLAAAPRPVAISPDGRLLVFNGQDRPGRRMLYQRQLGEFVAKPIPGTESGVFPFFSPDGKWIGFVDDTRGQLKKVPTSGGRAVTIGEHSTGSAWGANNIIVGSSPQGLVFFSADGGATTPFTALDSSRGERGHRDPVFLDDGRTVAFRIAVADESDGSRVGLASLDATSSGASRIPAHVSLDIPGGTPLGYAAGMLIIGRPDGTIVAVPVDLQRKTVSGQPVTVLEHVVWNRGPSAALSANGALIYVPGAGGSLLTVVDERGVVGETLEQPRRYLHPRWAPDGQRIAVEIVAADASSTDIWIYDVRSKVLSRLTSRGDAHRPEWTPDGERVAYITGRDAPSEAWWVPADKSSNDERLFALPRGSPGVLDLMFSPSGRHAVMRIGAGPPRTYDIWSLRLDARGAHDSLASALVATPFAEAMPRVSPKGDWLAYVSSEGGQSEVIVRPFPGGGGSVQVSTGGGSEPMWLPDGRRLVYRNGESFIAATLSFAPNGSPRVAVTKRAVLFEGRFASSSPSYSPPQFDVSPDGKRFVVVRPMSEGYEVAVVLNWVAELRQKVSATNR